MAKPNILLIVGEDTGALLSCYGYTDVRTPHLDRLAAAGCRFNEMYTTCAVCSPSRSTLVTGQYPIKLGTHHHRSQLLNPPRLFTHELRDAGYHVSWPDKRDFNFEPTAGWRDDDQPWLHRQLPQPWFAFTNIGVTHESCMWADREEYPAGRQDMAFVVNEKDRPARIIDPAKVTVPPYFPDTPVVRNDIARHCDNVTELDRRVGEILAALETSGQANNTIVIFTADHGRGLPREKRWPYPAGLHVPLIIRWPERLKPGSVDRQLVSMVDIAPMILSAAGVPIPGDYDGRPFLNAEQPRQYLFGGRDRMDEGFDRMRMVRDQDYLFIRNYFPQIPYCQRTRYGEFMMSMQELRRLNAAGKLHGEAAVFMQRTKPAEELYDLNADPHCVHNIIAHAGEVRRRLSDALDQFLAKMDDQGAYRERDLVAKGLVADWIPQCRERVAPLPAEFQKGYPMTVVEQTDLVAHET